MMKTWLRDAQGRWRNGIWMLVFVALFLLSRVVHRPLAEGLRVLGAGDAWREALGVVLLLGVTWACVRLRRESLRSVGLGLDRRWIGESALGLVAGGASALFAVAIMWTAGGVQFALDPHRAADLIVAGLWLFACAAMLEELLFRGFLFQRLVAGIGFSGAQLVMALLFALAHWSNPDIEGPARVIATIEIALGAILLGLAWHRTRSLAMPFGLHLGWNAMHGQVLGFDVSGFEQAGWFDPVLADAPHWMTGGGFGPEASVCAIAADLVLIALLWRWKGTRASAELRARDEAPVQVATGIRPRETCVATD
jgi:membrane protease YdiL (CAAX protease family)